jgi:hypothetical protein
VVGVGRAPEENLYVPTFSGRRAGPAVDASIEWRSERRHAETPVALTLAGERHDLEVVERWVEGPPVAGGPVVRCFVVRAGTGPAYLVRHDAAGAVAVLMMQ